MVAAVTLRAKLSGLLAEKSEMRHGVLEDASTEVLLLMRKQAELQIAHRKALEELPLQGKERALGGVSNR